MVTKNRIFISFAFEDSYARDFLVGQAKNNQSPFEFVDMSIKEPFDESWKTKCRTRIKGCDGLIALLSPKTMQATGARWEIWCAHDERIKVLGIHISKDKKGAIPPELSADPIIEWTWVGITNYLNEL
jgi:MTH538 TIR-like domain (DUF1863)